MVAGTSPGRSATRAILGQSLILVQPARGPGGAICSPVPFEVIKEGATCRFSQPFPVLLVSGRPARRVTIIIGCSEDGVSGRLCLHGSNRPEFPAVH